jgi:hypothetical protein
MMPRTTEPPGLASTSDIYTLEEVKRRLKLGDWALRQARRAGLKTHRIGRRTYIKGADLLAFLDRQAKPSPRGKKRRSA